MVKIIKKQILKLYIKKRKNEYLRNVFKTNFIKNVLLVYVTPAFDKKVSYSHSNLWECKIAGEIFSNLGYNVDVINYNSHKIPGIEKYSVIYGMGETFEKLFLKKGSNQIFINYATGCNPLWSNIETTRKIRTFYNRHGRMFPESSRLIHHTQHLQILLSEKVIVLGNDFVKNTYLAFDNEAKRYDNLNAFYFDFHNISPEDRNIPQCKKNFLWFGSSGALHKGLDVCLDYFRDKPDLDLHICGLNIESEKRFVDFYHREIYDTPNIHYHGFLKLDSIAFKNVLLKCGYVVFPSISEGGAVALLNVIGNGGLLPIYSKSTGVSFEKYGFEFNPITVENLDESIAKAVALNDDEYLNRAKKLKGNVRTDFTIDVYRENLKIIITNTINDNQA